MVASVARAEEEERRLMEEEEARLSIVPEKLVIITHLPSLRAESPLTTIRKVPITKIFKCQHLLIMPACGRANSSVGQ